MKRITYLLILLFTFTLSSCVAQDCRDLNENFENYNEAQSLIDNTNFNFTDDCSTSKSSWILKAQYFSCDKVTGYFLLTTKNKTYIHQKIPIELWSDFKLSSSFGKFYNQKIKGKYPLQLR